MIESKNFLAYNTHTLESFLKFLRCNISYNNFIKYKGYDPVDEI